MTSPAHLNLALSLATSLAGPLAPGLWQVGEMIQGTGRTRSSVHCHDGGPSWLSVAAPRVPTKNCRLPMSTAQSGRVAVGAPCSRGGTLSVTGTVGPDSFDLVTRRVGPVGGNPRATVTVVSQGRRTATRCPLSGGE